MVAYLARDYAGSVAHLTQWAEAAEGDPPELHRLALDVVSRVGQFVDSDQRETVEAAASALLERLAVK